MISTDAWVLHRGDGEGGAPGRLVREVFDFPDPAEDEVLARPLFGCWEGNMDHAIRRVPVDVCVMRNEDRVVLGNAGVVEVTRIGRAVADLAEGDRALVFCNGEPDEHGYPIRILGYDAPGTMGVLARTVKMKPSQLIRIPSSSRYSLQQWAAFSLRYITAWSNWHVAYTSWRSQMRDVPAAEVFVYGWGGGVSLAELTLAKHLGCQAVMITSKPARRALLESLGIETLDRSALGGESELLAAVQARTAGRGVSIFIDNIGASFRTTLKTLGRQAVIATSGWRAGMTFPIVRASECISRHIHVFTHYANRAEGLEAVRFAVENDWMPPLDGPDYEWDAVPELADDYAAGRIDSYFPIFAVNRPGQTG